MNIPSPPQAWLAARTPLGLELACFARKDRGLALALAVAAVIMLFYGYPILSFLLNWWSAAQILTSKIPGGQNQVQVAQFRKSCEIRVQSPFCAQCCYRALFPPHSTGFATRQASFPPVSSCSC